MQVITFHSDRGYRQKGFGNYQSLVWSFCPEGDIGKIEVRDFAGFDHKLHSVLSPSTGSRYIFRCSNSLAFF